METVDELNNAFVLKLLPNIIWMFICLVVGVVGNAVVLIVYRLRMKTKVNERYFIPILAVLDLLASGLSSLHGVMNYLYHYNYPSEMLCKIFNFGSFFTSAVSAHTLLLIAIQRYRKICVPLGKQMDIFWKRTSFIITAVVCLSYSVPVFFTAGIIHPKVGQTTTYLCAIDSDDYSQFNKVFYSVLFFVAFANIVAVTALYARMASSIYRRSNNRNIKRKGEKVCTTKIQNENTDSVLSHKVESETDDNQGSTDSSYLSSQSSKTASTILELRDIKPNPKPRMSSQGPDGFTETETNGKEVPTYSRKQQQQQQQKDTSSGEQNTKWNKTKVNFNKMFGAIIIVYLLSYTPTLVSFVVVSFGGFRGIDRNLFVFVNRFYIVNHIINPCIYGYFDFCFRHSLRSLLRCSK